MAGELLEAQTIAAKCDGRYCVLLAGPGTGKTKTLEHHVKYLIGEKGISPLQILVLTFTRAATSELRQRISRLLAQENGSLPRISTLHSFALSQILHNSGRIESLPRPIRIADDWEEREIIQEDLKVELSSSISEIREKFSLLSSDWQSLTADEEDWERKFPDPAFIGAWREHRNIYGYSLRSELVYQLKKAMQTTSEFSLDKQYSHIIIDEYQDLNRCDLATIKLIVEKSGAFLYVAGDDDQSIYGFRWAHPEGIRRFSKDYGGAEELKLRSCMRCGHNILELAEFVANLDPKRIQKGTVAYEKNPPGEVILLRFSDQYEEARGIAKICNALIKSGELLADDVLILLRNDRNKIFSSEIRTALESLSIPVNVNVEAVDPLKTTEGRIFLSHLRLALNIRDHLAWRTVLKLRANRIGSKKILSIIQVCKEQGIPFADTILAIKDNQIEGKFIDPSLQEEISYNLSLVEQIRETVNRKDPEKLTEDIESIKEYCADLKDIEAFKDAVSFLKDVATETNSSSFVELLKNVSASMEDYEQEVRSGKVNIMTMHKAKGLTATAVFVVSAEDQTIPGKNKGDLRKGDERRLFFVSLTRAKEYLFITYCTRRKGSQYFSGRQDGKPMRNLTEFLIDAPINLVDGRKYLKERGL